MAKILIIEDDLSVAQSVSFVLSEIGHITEITNGRDMAIDALNASKFDCIVTDIWLNDVDGLNFITEYRAIDPDVPIVVISGGGRKRTLEHSTAKADSFGIRHFLYKPFDEDELIGAIKDVIQEH